MSLKCRYIDIVVAGHILCWISQSASRLLAFQVTVPWPWRHAVQRCGSVWRCWKTVCKSSVTNWRWKRDRQIGNSCFLGWKNPLEFFRISMAKRLSSSFIFERERQGPLSRQDLFVHVLPSSWRRFYWMDHPELQVGKLQL